MLSTGFGLVVSWNGQSTVEIELDKRLAQKSTCGICGNFNGDPDDDWTIGPACPNSGQQVLAFSTFENYVITERSHKQA